MRFKTLPSGVKTIRFTMHGRPRLWAGASYLSILLAIPRHWFREAKLEAKQ